MKKLLFPLLAGFALTAGTAAAQTTTPDAMPSIAQDRGNGRLPGTPEEMAQRQAKHLSKELALTADQTPKMQAILLARTQETQALRAQAHDGSNRGQLRGQLQATRAKYDAQFKAVLTPEQYTKFTALQADRLERAREMRQDGGPDVKKLKATSTDGDKVKIKAQN